KTNLIDAGFDEVVISRSHFQGANMQGMTTKKTDMTHTKIIDCNLDRAVLTLSDLRGAKITRGSMNSIYCSNMHFEDVKIKAVRMSSGKFLDSNFARAEISAVDWDEVE